MRHQWNTTSTTNIKLHISCPVEYTQWIGTYNVACNYACQYTQYSAFLECVSEAHAINQFKSNVRVKL